jgi:hypothetical protein
MHGSVTDRKARAPIPVAAGESLKLGGGQRFDQPLDVG